MAFLIEPLQITAILANGIAVYEDWSPQLEGLLIYQLLSKRGLVTPNPSHGQVTKNIAAIADDIPLAMWEGIYKCSSPVYRYRCEETTKFRKRWEPDGRVNWGKRKPKFDTSQGAEKSYDLPLFLRLTPRIDWFAVGDRQEVERLLSGVAGLGKKRGHGYGQVTRWEVKAVSEDWSIKKGDQLMKAIPAGLFKELGLPLSHDLIQWGYKPPVWLPEHKALCVMPRLVEQC